ncbi:MAG: MBL fold metallo-hydrolase [Candidatus Hydrogenedentes bacterium]|nr:MBL fold metallo-hydrolase [Candidatus Hydrogenedentota bacterium]
MEVKVYELTPFLVNTYIVIDNNEAIVIDPGESNLRLIRDLNGLKVKAIINTHCHIDHCGGNASLCRATGAPLLMHPESEVVLQTLGQQALLFGVPFQDSPPPDGYLQEGDEISVGNTTFKVLYTPGHAPGHICIVSNGHAFVGDVLFQGSIGRTDLPGGDYELLISSIRNKLFNLPDDTVVYPGHGPTTTIGIERETNPFVGEL